VIDEVERTDWLCLIGMKNQLHQEGVRLGQPVQRNRFRLGEKGLLRFGIPDTSHLEPAF
jgi:hypothetical protein